MDKIKHERFIADDINEMIWLRINRLRSVKLCEMLIEDKIKANKSTNISEELLKEKATGLSSAIESAIGYWNYKTDNLNAKILSRYYALLQMTIAEQVASIKNLDTLSVIQKHTEFGHGLSTISDKNGRFPFNYYVSILESGHFASYLRYLNYDVKNISFSRRERKFEKITEKNKLISLVDLITRIPELRPVIEEYLGVSPKTFQIVYADKNHEIDIERRRQQLHNNGNDCKIAEEKEKVTYIKLLTQSDLTNMQDIEHASIPFTNIVEEIEDISRYKNRGFLGEFKHPKEGYWYDYLNLYKSSFCGTSYVVPIADTISDVILINFMLLYALSIIVRYLPDLWHKVTKGEYNHIGSLIEYYLSIADKVIPLKMLERITERRISIDVPGSINTPV